MLQLAVTGKLVTQDNRDEPASVLLESTEAERAKLVAAKKIKSRLTSPVESDEQPLDLPSSWAWARLSDVGYELGQKVPDKRFTYIDVGGIDSDKGRISDRVEKLEAGDAPSRARKLVARGTVIYSTIRPYLLNIAIVDQDFDPEPIASTAFGILHPFAGINNRYLFYWLRSAPFTAYVQAEMKGMAYPAINDEKFYSGFIALPPLAEQKRIVAKVDELMALCDRLEAQQQEREMRHASLARASLARFSDAYTPANLQFLFHPSYGIPPADLRKSILTLAVKGKLVPQDHSDEPAEILLLKIQQRRSELQSSSRIPKPEPQLSEEDGYEDALPISWKQVRIGDLCLSIVPQRDKPLSFTGDIPWVTLPVFKENSVSLKLEADCEGLSPDEVKKYRLRIVPAGSVLMSCIGRFGLVAVLEQDVVPNQQIHGFYFPTEFIEGRFLCYSIMAQKEFLEAQATTTTIAYLNKTKCESVPVALPPLAEQRRIVAKVDQLMALLDELEAHIAASRITASKLLDAIVAELTTQA
ncbi:MAG: restriction endonuclease subunit S [Pseudomonadota bacterium]